jgi:hypothetical protein
MSYGVTMGFGRRSCRRGCRVRSKGLLYRNLKPARRQSLPDLLLGYPLGPAGALLRGAFGEPAHGQGVIAGPQGRGLFTDLPAGVNISLEILVSRATVQGAQQ